MPESDYEIIKELEGLEKEAHEAFLRYVDEERKKHQGLPYGDISKFLQNWLDALKPYCKKFREVYPDA
ncbi:MAG: hypothetical protein WC891_02180 [Actinomycetota bacterium]